MATNLRLRPDAEAAVRAEAERTGRSQQEVLREAVDRYLDLRPTPGGEGDLDVLAARGVVRRPRTPYRGGRPTIVLEHGTSLELLDRRDRL